MNYWPYPPKPYSPQEVREAVADVYWQMFRKGLKGMSTPDKLDHLDAYRENRIKASSTETLPRTFEVQIDNYINSLKRGGLLTMTLEVNR